MITSINFGNDKNSVLVIEIYIKSSDLYSKIE